MILSEMPVAEPCNDVHNDFNLSVYIIFRILLLLVVCFVIHRILLLDIDPFLEALQPLRAIIVRIT